MSQFDQKHMDRCCLCTNHVGHVVVEAQDSGVVFRVVHQHMPWELVGAVPTPHAQYPLVAITVDGLLSSWTADGVGCTGANTRSTSNVGSSPKPICKMTRSGETCDVTLLHTIARLRSRKPADSYDAFR